MSRGRRLRSLKLTLGRYLTVARLWRPALRNRLRGFLKKETGNYPPATAVGGPNRLVVEFLRSTDCRMIAEIGVYRGHTSREIAKWLGNSGELHLFDYDDAAQNVAASLRLSGYSNIRAYGNSYRYLDSYNWSLGQVLRDNPSPIYDFVFIDGAHTWAVDGFATLLVDRLLKPGGYLAHDDYGWTLERSPSMRPEVFPLTRKSYSDEQMRTMQVKMICELLIRRDDRYEEVVENTIWRKTRA